MKKVLKPVLITFIILAGLTGGGIYLLTKNTGVSDEFASRIVSEQSDLEQNRAYRYDTDDLATPLVLSGENKNVLNFDSSEVYNVVNSQAARDRIDRLLKRSAATFEQPIIAANPFGTNNNTFYFNFESSYRGMIRYTIAVADETIQDHIRYVNNGQEDNLSKQHEFTVSGLIPGMKNYIILELLDSTGSQRGEKIYSYDVPASNAKTKLSMQKGTSRETSKNGLFFVFPSGDSQIYVYDNLGYLRNTVNTEGNHGKRIYQAGDSVIYQVSHTKIARVEGTGQVTGVAEVKGYGCVRDFSYDGYGNVYSLVTKKKKDYLVVTSFQSGKTKVIYKFPNGVSANTLTAPKNGNIYVATAKPSGLLQITAVTGKVPKAAFVLGQKNAWKKTAWKKKVTEEKTAKTWNLSSAILNLDDEQKHADRDELSMYAFVNERGTGLRFSLDAKQNIQTEISLPTGQSGVCGCQTYEGHNILFAGKTGTVEEYDSAGKVTNQIVYGSAIDNAVKLSLTNMCFYAG